MSKNELKFNWLDYIDKKQLQSKKFKIAFTHPSNKGYNASIDTNERLELIGDKVLDLVLYHFLYKKYKNTISKGKMDNLRQELMSAIGLSKIFDFINLGDFLIKPPNYNLPLSPKVKHNIVESLIGAIFLEDGYEIAFKFIIELFEKVEF